MGLSSEHLNSIHEILGSILSTTSRHSQAGTWHSAFMSLLEPRWYPRGHVRISYHSPSSATQGKPFPCDPGPRSRESDALEVNKNLTCRRLHPSDSHGWRDCWNTSRFGLSHVILGTQNSYNTLFICLMFQKGLANSERHGKIWALSLVSLNISLLWLCPSLPAGCGVPSG